VGPHKPNTLEQDLSLQGECITYTREGKKEPGFASAMVPTLEEEVIQEGLPPASRAESSPLRDKLEHWPSECSDPSEKHTADGEAYGALALASRNPQADDEPPHTESEVNDVDDHEKTAPAIRPMLRKHLTGKVSNKAWAVPVPAPHVDPEGFEDPISDAFWRDVWLSCAVHNVSYASLEAISLFIFVQTEIYRKVFHAVPDDLITTWKQYKEFVIHHERFAKPVSTFAFFVACLSILLKAKDHHSPDPVARVPSETAYENGPYQNGGVADVAEKSRETIRTGTNDGSDTAPSRGSNPPDRETRQKPTHGVEPLTKQERDEMEELLKEVRGHLGEQPIPLRAISLS